MDKNISDAIVQTCKKYGIDYKSSNPNYIEFCNDAKRLGELYLQLKIIAGELKIIGDRHNIAGLANMLKDDIKALETVEHDIIKLAKRFKNE